MNRVAFQTYGTKKLSLFQSVWKTDQAGAVSITEQAGITATGTLTNWALASVGGSLLNGGYTHTAGSTAVLQFGLVPTAGQSYQMKYTATGTGTFVINFGGISSAALNPGTNVIVTLTPKTAATLSITPSSSFVGTVSLSIKQSSSATNQIQLPISIASGKSIWVDWGDGQYSTMNNSNIVANRIHTYAAPDTYTVRVFGDNFTFGLGIGGFNDRLKLRSISSWGKLKIAANSFYGCSYVTMSGITDIPDLTGVTDLTGAFYDCIEITTIGRINEWNTSSLLNAGALFRGCYKFNSDISNWNVSNVTNMGAMFYDARVFNQPIGNWERSTLGNVSTVSKVNNMSSMFSSAYAFNQPIGNWNISNVTYMGYVFRNAYAFNQNLSNWERADSSLSKVNSFENMFESATAFNNGSASGAANQLSWNINTTAASVNMFSMFKSATAFNSNLGAGTTPWNISKVTTFQSMFQGASKFNNGNDTAPINNWNIGGSVTGTITLESMFASASAFNRDISGWDVSKVNTLSGIFSNAINFENGLNTNINPVTLRAGLDGWNIVVTGNMYGVFLGASKFNRPLSNWNTTSVTWMLSMFQNAVLFNQDISSWNVGNVTNMGSMFAGAIQFNQDLSRWNVGKVTIFTGTFSGATAFNNSGNSVTNPITSRTGINGWNIGTTASSVVTNQMFQNTNFNRYIGDWDVSKVTAMGNMFLSNGSFNQDLSKWNVGSVTSMDAMFYNADAFTNGSNTNTNPVTGLTGINGWNINTSPAASVTMGSMFATNNAFNQPIGSWNVSQVTDMSYMFYGTSAFNQPIGSWDVSNVRNMSYMFQGATAFNQNIGSWNVSNVTNMNSMFNSAAAFNQNIGSWNVSNVTNFSIFMGGKLPATFSSTNLDAIYNGWGSLPSVKPNTTLPLSTNISFGTAKYTAASSVKRAVLTSAPNNWIIQDGGI